MEGQTAGVERLKNFFLLAFMEGDQYRLSFLRCTLLKGTHVRRVRAGIVAALWRADVPAPCRLPTGGRVNNIKEAKGHGVNG